MRKLTTFFWRYAREHLLKKQIISSFSNRQKIEKIFMTLQRNIFSLLPLFLVIMIDSMGLGILFPIMSDLLINQNSGFLSAHTSELIRELLFGVTIGIFMIAWFFGSAILGDLSDGIGRKKSLLICLFGAGCGYLISAIAIVFHSLLFLIVGRVIAGVYSLLITIFSNQVSDAEQGWVMGITNSV